MMPTNTLWQQAIRCHQLGDMPGAERLCGQLIHLDPRHAPAHHMLGTIRAVQGRPVEALDLMRIAVRAMPNDATAHFTIGNALLALDRADEALASLSRAVKLAPQHSDARNSRGVALQRLERHGEAMASYDRALALAPGHVFAHFNRANLLQFQARHDEALAGYDRVLALAPQHAGARNNRGWSLLNLRRLEEAQADFRAALRLNPAEHGARLNEGFLHLLRGDFTRGLPLYEYRMRLARPLDAVPFPQPRWTGAEDIAGKTLFVHHGQGIGDMLQFHRYAVAAAARGAHVMLAMPTGLMRLMGGHVHKLELVNRPPEVFDYYISLMSLPLALGATADTIAASGRQLAAETALRERWARRLESDGAFTIGVAWAGKDDMGKGFVPEVLAGIAALENVRLVCLQKDAPPPRGVAMTHFRDLDRGPDAFLDTAAIMENCDLVITADTATAHLAGALGVPAWVALKYVPDWRWFLDRDDSPWWASLRLFRQQRPGDWAGVFAAMEEELRIRLATRQYPRIQGE
jgi:tetratricopeptide (TPR) repeat protein